MAQSPPYSEHGYFISEKKYLKYLKCLKRPVDFNGASRYEPMLFSMKVNILGYEEMRRETENPFGGFIA